MAVQKHVAYYRVSTEKQGRSGLGIEAQKEAVRSYLNGDVWDLVGEFTEVESGKRSDNRPQLDEALRMCRLTGAKLIVAKLDRLSRNVRFLAELQEGGVPFVAVDMPDANELTVHIMAAVAQAERKAISRRTKEALAAVKARGILLGGAREGAPPPPPPAIGAKASAKVRNAKANQKATDLIRTINDFRKLGVTSLRNLADSLNAANIPTPRGSGLWQAGQVRRVIHRAEKLEGQR